MAKNLFLFALALFSSQLCASHVSQMEVPSSDWMNCDHGYFNQNYDDCSCDSEWYGIECNVCESDDACPTGSQCEELELDSFTFYGMTGVSCNTFPSGIYSNENWGAGFSFDFYNGIDAVVSFTTYVNYFGAPYLFNCTFEDCVNDNTYGPGFQCYTTQ
eukprot:TRINITY_DN4290_c0_g1_i2.p1 TRINITY_DN4290_c0_g1~~TRINITY_DN4290_c0_g1_i2.p1  ORF type:complete len:159 (-),score=10.66 TRINITY_DN4290_c0_g1_i2:52-528(-)